MDFGGAVDLDELVNSLQQGNDPTAAMAFDHLIFPRSPPRPMAGDMPRPTLPAEPGDWTGIQLFVQRHEVHRVDNPDIPELKEYLVSNLKKFPAEVILRDRTGAAAAPVPPFAWPRVACVRLVSGPVTPISPTALCSPPWSACLCCTRLFSVGAGAVCSFAFRRENMKRQTIFRKYSIYAIAKNKRTLTQHTPTESTESERERERILETLWNIHTSQRDSLAGPQEQRTAPLSFTADVRLALV